MAVVSERLKLFLYLLMRDHLPTGKVASLLSDLGDVEEVYFTAPELEALAERYAKVLGS